MRITGNHRHCSSNIHSSHIHTIQAHTEEDKKSTSFKIETKDFVSVCIVWFAYYWMGLHTKIKMQTCFVAPSWGQLHINSAHPARRRQKAMYTSTKLSVFRLRFITNKTTTLLPWIGLTSIGCVCSKNLFKLHTHSNKYCTCWSDCTWYSTVQYHYRLCFVFYGRKSCVYSSQPPHNSSIINWMDQFMIYFYLFGAHKFIDRHMKKVCVLFFGHWLCNKFAIVNGHLEKKVVNKVH